MERKRVTLTTAEWERLGAWLRSKPGDWLRARSLEQVVAACRSEIGLRATTHNVRTAATLIPVEIGVPDAQGGTTKRSAYYWLARAVVDMADELGRLRGVPYVVPAAVEDLVRRFRPAQRYGSDAGVHAGEVEA